MKISSLNPSVLLVIAIFTLGGCSTTPVATADAAFVPSERITDPSYLSAKDARTIPVTIKRDRGFTGGGLKHVFSIDGHEVARFGPGEKLVIYLAAGRYVFGIYPTPNLFKTHTTEETEAVIEGGRELKYRIYSSQDMVAKIERTAL